MRTSMCLLLGAILGLNAWAQGAVSVPVGQRQMLAEGWQLKSSVVVPEDGRQVSTVGYQPQQWYKTAVPATVLTALVKNGVYPDPRNALDCYRIPDACEEFNKKYDLGKYSHLPDKRNPWRDPYWYRTEFDVAAPPAGSQAWLNFQSINYRAEVWLNGARIAEKDRMVGMFQRFRLDVTTHLRPGRNALAVKIHPVDHPGMPDKQLKVFGPSRGEHKEIELDVTEIETVGYDCMMTVPDRNMGICQDVFLDWTGSVDLRDPFIVTELPLPDTTRALLKISAELINTASTPVRGVLQGNVPGTDVRFEQPVELAPNETKLVLVDPKPVMQNPRLWWPVNYGAQPLYDLVLQFASGGSVSAEHKVRFGVRQIDCQMHKLDGWHGRRVLVNGQKVYCRGGYIQPELMLDWNARRIDNEIRYFADANLNLIYFEDIPNPPDAFMEACDRRGVLFGNCFYACSWMDRPGRPKDLGLLERCTIDLVKRYRNHPSLIMYMSMDEGYTREEVYTMWRRHVKSLDGTRFWIPSAYLADYIGGKPVADVKRMAHFKDDLPTGMNDVSPKSYGWQEPVTYFRWVREDRSWMFKMESGSASLPPMSSLAKFLPDLGARSTDGAPYPLNETWAHHGANHYYKPYDEAVRRLHGEPESVAEYCWKGHLTTADQHRAFYEAVNHRLWDITSGFTQWKINSCYPDVQWQIFDYYHKPVVSYFFIKRACEPLHVQFNLIDHAVSVINCRLEPQPDLQVTARVFDLASKLLWHRTAKLSASANAYREAFVIDGLAKMGPLTLVQVELHDAAGHVVSSDCYWVRGEGVADFRRLQELPLVKLDAAVEKVEDQGEEQLVRVKVTNPTGSIALLAQLALVRGRGGEEVLPVLWQDNYFSLLPGQTREVTARIARRDLAGKEVSLEVGGWNVQTDYACTGLKLSQPAVKLGESVTVSARIAETFLDGSRVTLAVDGKPSGAKWAWARGGKTDEVSFTLSLPQAGAHRVTVGKQEAEVTVK